MNVRTKQKIWLGCALAVLVIGVGVWAQQPIQLQTVNGGGAVALGHGTAATALRVELPTDGTGLVSAAQSGSWAVTGSGNFSIIGVPTTSSANALTLVHNSSAAAANAKASAGNLYGLILGNNGTIPCWLQIFNNAGTPTAGTSVIDSFMVQAGVTLPIPPGMIALKNYSTGIAYAGATSDSGATTTGCTTTFSVSLYLQ